jgi:hypothetical protein
LSVLQVNVFIDNLLTDRVKRPLARESLHKTAR